MKRTNPFAHPATLILLALSSLAACSDAGPASLAAPEEQADIGYPLPREDPRAILDIDPSLYPEAMSPRSR